MAITADGLGKRYHRYDETTPTRLKDLVLSGLRGLRPPGSFWALRDVSLTVDEGRTLGLIGHNGAGKSTLLELAAGVILPDEGEVSVDGRISALFELGTGFHDDLTGRESAITAAVIAGLSHAEARRRLGAMVSFAELGEFIDSPLRTYSSGMRARLAFAIASHVDPDVLLIDEILSVGDLAFQERCLERLREFQRAGVTMLVVSHDPWLLEDLCDEVLWLRGGRVVGRGPAARITEQYRRRAGAGDTPPPTPEELGSVRTSGGVLLRPGDNRVGTQRAQVERVQLLDGWGRQTETIEAGDPLRLRARVRSSEGGVLVRVSLHRDDDLQVLDASTQFPGATGWVELELGRLDLAPGRYAFSVGLHSPDWSTTHDHHDRAYPLRVPGSEPDPGTAVLAPPLRWVVTGDDGP